MHLDFETRSRIDLPRTGEFRYAEDPSTELLCVSFGDGERVPTVVNLQEDPRSPKLAPLFEAVTRGERLVAHHAHFERAIWEYICTPRHGWPLPKPAQWKCTAAKAAAAAYPRSLQNVGLALGLRTQKDPKGAKLIRLFCKPQKDGAFVDWRERMDDFNALLDYCRQDTIVEREVDHALPDLLPHEELIFRLDYAINKRGIPIDVSLARRAQEIADELDADLKERALEITDGLIRTTQRDKLIEWLNGAGQPMDTLQAQEVERVIADPATRPEFRELLEIRMEATRAGIKKLGSLLECVSPDGRIRGGYMYHAAGPGRWASMRVQFHNFAKGSPVAQDVLLGLLERPDARGVLGLFFDRPLTALSAAMRGFLAAPPGRDLMVADFAAVEARALAWLADEPFILNQYRGDGKVYEAMAAKIHNVPIEHVSQSQRWLGKQVVLGAGYMEGWLKFQAQCAKYGVVIDEETARTVIAGYRESVPNIVKLWRDIENAALRCVHEKKEQSIANGRVRFRLRGRALQMVLPSGRAICYPEPEIQLIEKFGRNRYTLHCKTEWKKIWVTEPVFPPRLIENAIQGICRDLLADALIRAETHGYPVIGHTHDEIQSEIEEGSGDVHEFEHLICELPSWAKDLPLAAKGFRSKRYRKD